jgi:hypothetical protein
MNEWLSLIFFDLYDVYSKSINIQRITCRLKRLLKKEGRKEAAGWIYKHIYI